MSLIQGKIHTFYACAKTHSYENQPLMVSQRVPLSGLVITSPTRCWFRTSWGCKQRGKYYALLKSEMKNEKIKKKVRPQRPPPSRPASSPSWTPWLPPLSLAGSAAQRKTRLPQCKQARQSWTKRSESTTRTKKREIYYTRNM